MAWAAVSVGVPLMAPVDASRERPAGRAGWTSKVHQPQLTVGVWVAIW